MMSQDSTPVVLRRNCKAVVIPAGFEIELNKNELSSTGVLYYTIETSSDMKGQRMILLH